MSIFCICDALITSSLSLSLSLSLPLSLSCHPTYSIQFCTQNHSPGTAFTTASASRGASGSATPITPLPESNPNRNPDQNHHRNVLMRSPTLDLLASSPMGDHPIGYTTRHHTRHHSTHHTLHRHRSQTTSEPAPAPTRVRGIDEPMQGTALHARRRAVSNGASGRPLPALVRLRRTPSQDLAGGCQSQVQ